IAELLNHRTGMGWTGSPKALRWLLPLLCGLVLTGCGDIDTVESRYQTRADAEADLLFARGWLPEIIPDSSRGIVTKNDLDLNLSEGEFYFDREDLDAFLSHLRRLPESDSRKFQAYAFEN